MAKRKKRLEKGIESLRKQVEIHEKKLADAKEMGAEELVTYLEKDLRRLEHEKEKKEDQLG
ncbi:hypothetical protein CMI37_07730 [Candidatus Pacearchaeota archaeon]|nr:hypothetical protein [Candidatus Pacearchaeota archaeon]|tara:strand:+ start:1030 stop:1212 length:183 start_codon:yes stop_codon:yes gene_type:complete